MTNILLWGARFEHCDWYSTELAMYYALSSSLISGRSLKGAECYVSFVNHMDGLVQFKPLLLIKLTIRCMFSVILPSYCVCVGRTLLWTSWLVLIHVWSCFLLRVVSWKVDMLKSLGLHLVRTKKNGDWGILFVKQIVCSQSRYPRHSSIVER